MRKTKAHPGTEIIKKLSVPLPEGLIMRRVQGKMKE
jgi:hypothetical protein